MELCKTVARLYLNLIHGSGNRKGRPPRRWLKTRTWESYELPDESPWLLVSTPCGKFVLTRFHPVFLNFHDHFPFFINRILWPRRGIHKFATLYRLNVKFPIFRIRCFMNSTQNSQLALLPVLWNIRVAYLVHLTLFIKLCFRNISIVWYQTD